MCQLFVSDKRENAHLRIVSVLLLHLNSDCIVVMCLAVLYDTYLVLLDEKLPLHYCYCYQ
jgi:hypothetical protein